MEIAKLISNPSLKKPWLKYFKHQRINEEIINNNLYDNLLITNQDNLDKTALVYRKRKISYEELLLIINKCIESFQVLNVKKGYNVLLALPEMPELIYSIYSLSKIGAILNYTQIDNLERTINKINNYAGDILIILDETYNIIKRHMTKKYKYIILVAINDSSLNRCRRKNVENTISWSSFISYKTSEEINCTYGYKQILLKHNGIVYNNEIFNVSKYFFQKSCQITDEKILIDYDINNFSIYISILHTMLLNNTIYLEPKKDYKKKLINNINVILTNNKQNIKLFKTCFLIINDNNYYQSDARKIIFDESALFFLFKSKIKEIGYLPIISNDICIWNEKKKRECTINENGNVCINNKYADRKYANLHSDNKYWIHTNYTGCLKKDGSFTINNL